MQSSLNSEKYSDALRKGLGRAYLDIKENGLSGKEDLLIRATVRNLNYDPQIEDSRAPWLFQILKEARLIESAERALLDQIGALESDWDFEQAVDLLYYFAESGSRDAKAELVSLVSQERIRSSHLLPERILDLHGIDGLAMLLKGIEKNLDTTEIWLMDEAIYSAARRFGTELVESQIATHLGNPAIRTAIFDRLKTQPEGGRSIQQSTERRTLNSLLEAVESERSTIPYYYSRFAKDLTVQEKEQLVERIVNESRAPQLIRLLYTFRSSPLPHLPDQILQLIFSADEALRDAAISAVSRSKDSRIHQSFYRFILDKSPSRALQSLPLLIKNYQSADAATIEELLIQIPLDQNPEELHSIGFDLLQVTEHKPDPQNTPLLLWIYEYSPCTNCRGKAVEHLAALGRLPQYIREEGPFDANSEIRALVSPNTSANFG